MTTSGEMKNPETSHVRVIKKGLTETADDRTGGRYYIRTGMKFTDCRLVTKYAYCATLLNQ